MDDTQNLVTIGGNKMPVVKSSSFDVSNLRANTSFLVRKDDETVVILDIKDTSCKITPFDSIEEAKTSYSSNSLIKVIKDEEDELEFYVDLNNLKKVLDSQGLISEFVDLIMEYGIIVDANDILSLIVTLQKEFSTEYILNILMNFEKHEIIALINTPSPMEYFSYLISGVTLDGDDNFTDSETVSTNSENVAQPGDDDYEPYGDDVSDGFISDTDDDFEYNEIDSEDEEYEF